MTLTRAETPSQRCCGELYLACVASVPAATRESSPRCWRSSSGGEFSVRKMSAGECLPSCTIWAASTPSSSDLTATLMPVCFSKAATSAATVCGCWPL